MAVLSLFAGASFGAEVVLMEDNFNGLAGVSLSGKAPETVHPELTGRMWEGSGSMTYDGAGGMIGTANSYRAAAFDIRGAYTDTNTITLKVVLQNDENKWAAIGFAAAANESNADDNAGWINIFGDLNSTPGSGKLREGPGIGGGTSVTMTTGHWNVGTTNLVEIEYNLNDGGDGDGTIRAYVNGTLAATLADCSSIGMPDFIHLAYNNGAGTTAGGQFFDSVQIRSDGPVPELTILQDDFDGTADVSVAGNAPDILTGTLSGNVWEGSAAMKYDGTGGMKNSGLTSYQAASFKIQGAYSAENTLRLTAVLQNDESQWAGIGFATNVLANGLTHNVAWVNISGDGAATPGAGKLREGPSTAGASTSLTTGLWNTGAANTLVIEYDLKDDGDGNGTLKAYLNGTLAATVADTSAIGMPKYIHLAFNNGGGTTAGGQFFDSIQLTTDGPAPTVEPFAAIADPTGLIANSDFLQYTTSDPGFNGGWNVADSHGAFWAYTNQYADVTGWSFYYSDPNNLIAETGPGGQLELTDKVGTTYSSAGRVAMNSSYGYRNGMMQADILNGLTIKAGAAYRFEIDLKQNATKDNSLNTFTAALTVGGTTNTLVQVSPTTSLPLHTDPSAPQTSIVSGADLLAAQGSGPVNVIFETLNTDTISGWPGAVLDPLDTDEVSQTFIYKVSLALNIPGGDVNKDGVVDEADVTLAETYLAGDGGESATNRQATLIGLGYTPAEALEFLNLTEFDIDGDDYFDAVDVGLIDLLVVNLPVTLQIASNGAMMDFQWNSNGGQLYDLESTTSLAIPDWQGVAGYTNMAASGTGINTLDDVAVDGAVKFYRVIEK